MNSRIRLLISDKAFFAFPGIFRIFSPKDTFGTAGAVVSVCVCPPLSFSCADGRSLTSISITVPSGFTTRTVFLSSPVETSNVSASSVSASVSVEEELLPPLMTLKPHPREPWSGVPVAKAIPIGSTARKTLQIPVNMIRRKYSLRKKRKQNPHAIPMQHNPAIIVP